MSSLAGLVLWFGCLLGAHIVRATSCNADNCLRALFPTQSPAAYSSDAAFCATFTTAVNTMTTGFPSRASAACGTAASRYSSACSCRPTISSTLSSTSKTSATATTTSTTRTTSSTTSTTSTCTPTPYNNVVRNGGFECGLSPWIAADISGTSHSITTPGDNSAFTYQFNQIGPVTGDSYSAPASVNQDLSVVVGTSYILTFRTFFDKCTGSEGFVGVMLNHQPVYTVDACDHGAGDFTDNTVTFTATVNPFNLRFEFIIAENPATVKIDNVVVVPQ